MTNSAAIACSRPTQLTTITLTIPRLYHCKLAPAMPRAGVRGSFVFRKKPRHRLLVLAFPALGTFLLIGNGAGGRHDSYVLTRSRFDGLYHRELLHLLL